MALSNTVGSLVLATGNKSEMSVGYSTLYGDMAGGFAVIKDVPKQLVYELVKYRNAPRRRRARPRVGDRAGALGRASPRSARRRLAAAVRDARPGRSRAMSSATSRATSSSPRGSPAEVVDEVVRLVNRAEYKRRQARARASGSRRRRSAATGGCRSPTATRAEPGRQAPDRRADRDRHPHQRAESTRVVAELAVPDPGRAAAMARARRRGRAVGDRAEERRTGSTGRTRACRRRATAARSPSSRCSPRSPIAPPWTIPNGCRTSSATGSAP